MGTDIHIITEIKRQGRWEVIEDPKIKQFESDAWFSKKHYPLEIYDGRNYNLFAILADVRNGYGFAGIKTGLGFKPISPRKGLPEDLSVDCDTDDFWLGDHSHSYLTLKEIMDFDWDQTTINFFGLDFEVFEQNKHLVTDIELIPGRTTFKKQVFPSFGDSTAPYVKCCTKVSYWEAAGSGFTLNTIPCLLRLTQFADNKSQENIRIVFGFDS